MSFTKTKIYNLAFSALLLARQVSDVDADITSNEVKILNNYWEDALSQTLADMDLDGLSEPIQLELITELNDDGPWQYVYKYPTRCAFLRRIQSHVRKDNRVTAIEKNTGLYLGQKAIFTNETAAVAEIIPNDISLASLPPSGGWAVALHLAFLSCPLLTGKGAKTLSSDIWQRYLLALSKAQEQDERENFNYENPVVVSEFVAARLD